MPPLAVDVIETVAVLDAPSSLRAVKSVVGVVFTDEQLSGGTFDSELLLGGLFGDEVLA